MGFANYRLKMKGFLLLSLFVLSGRALANESCGPTVLKALFQKNAALIGNEYIDPGIMCRYNLKTICTIQFTKKSLRDLQSLYQHSRIPGVVQKIALDINTPYNELQAVHPGLVLNQKSLRSVISANPPRLSVKRIISAFSDGKLDTIKEEPDGLSLLAWYIHPELRPRLIRASCPECLRYLDLNPSGTYLTTIMDLNRSHINYLKSLKAASIEHLREHYGYQEGKDVVSLFFHFPTGPDTSSLHLHIRLNQNFPVTEMARNFDIDQVIQYLENGKSTTDLILDRQKFLGGFTPIAPDVAKFMGKIAEPTIEYRKNPYFMEPLND